MDETGRIFKQRLEPAFLNVTWTTKSNSEETWNDRGKAAQSVNEAGTSCCLMLGMQIFHQRSKNFEITIVYLHSFYLTTPQHVTLQ